MDFGEPTDGPSIHDLIIEDMKARKQFGRDKYDTLLQGLNGRDALRVAYEEILDLAVHLRQVHAETWQPVGHSTEPVPEDYTVDQAADGIMASLDSIAEELPGVHEAVGNRIGVRYFQWHGGQIGSVPMDEIKKINYGTDRLLAKVEWNPNAEPGVPQFTTEWAQRLVSARRIPDEKYIAQIKAVREASGIDPSTGLVRLGLGEAKDLVTTFNPKLQEAARRAAEDGFDSPVNVVTRPKERQVMVLEPELIEVSQELARQHEKWGEQNHPNGTGMTVRNILPMAGVYFDQIASGYQRICDLKAKDGTLTWRDIFLEEVFEAMAEDDEENLIAELTQAAAVAVQWVRAIKRRQNDVAVIDSINESDNAQTEAVDSSDLY